MDWQLWYNKYRRLIMKKILIIFILILCGALAYCDQLTNIHKCDKAPKIDGILDDDCYKDCAVVGYFLTLSDNSIGSIKDKVYITYDEKNIYFGLDVYVSNPSISSFNEKNGKVWYDDDVEIYIQPDLGKRTYFMLGMNGGNSCYLGLGKSYAEKNNTIYKSFSTEKGWQGEIALPWSDIGVTEPSIMGLNICGYKKNDQILYTWNDLKGLSFHTPEKFGRMTFDENLPVFRLDLLDFAEHNLTVKGELVGEGPFDYSLEANGEIKKNSLSNEVNIKDSFKDGKGTFHLLLNKGGKTFYRSDFIAGTAKLYCDLVGDKLKVKIDLNNVALEPYTKVSLTVCEPNKSKSRLDRKIYFGENLNYQEPICKEYEFKLPKKGEYWVRLELINASGRIKLVDETVKY